MNNIVLVGRYPNFHCDYDLSDNAIGPYSTERPESGKSQHVPIIVGAGSSLSNDHARHSNFRVWHAHSFDVESFGARGGSGKRSDGQV